MHLLFFIMLMTGTKCKLESKQTRRVIKGDEDLLFPFFAQLEIPILSNITHNAALVCGSTLIHPQWILTAAHCLESQDGTKIELDTINVYVGSVKVYDKKAKINKLSTKFIHPRYQAQFNSNEKLVKCLYDVALAQLKKPYKTGKNVQLVRLPTESVPRCSVGTIVGIGKIKYYPPVFPNLVQYARVRAIERSALENPIIIPESSTIFFSEAPIKGGPNAFEGDSGGPYICYIGSVPVQYGVISQSENDTENMKVQTAYESVLSHMDFILTHLPNVMVYEQRRSITLAAATRNIPFLGIFVVLYVLRYM